MNNENSNKDLFFGNEVAKGLRGLLDDDLIDLRCYLPVGSEPIISIRNMFTIVIKAINELHKRLKKLESVDNN